MKTTLFKKLYQVSIFYSYIISMTIIQALKKLKLLDKKMQSNVNDIRKYSSILDTEMPAFWTKDQQEAHVRSLIQSNLDLSKEYAATKQAIEKANLENTIKAWGLELTISEAIIMKRHLIGVLESTYQALSTNAAASKPKTNKADWTQSQVIQLYDETHRNASLSFYSTLESEIDGELEVANATIHVSL